MITIFNLSSRLGMVYKPYGGNEELNIGVEDGGEAILTNEFRQSLPEHKVIEFTYSNPSNIPEIESLPVFTRETQEAKNILLRLSTGDDIQITIGGDHSTSLASVLATLERHQNKKVGYIQIDSHADLHLVKTTPSGNIHGMWARVFMDEFDFLPLNSIAPNKISPENVLYIGNLDIQKEEEDFISNNKILNISKKSISKKYSIVEKWITQFDHIHVSFDIDSLDSSFAPATGIPAVDGLTKNQALKLIEIIKNHSSFSFDLVELNPKKDGAEQTIAFAQLLLCKLLV